MRGVLSNAREGPSHKRKRFDAALDNEPAEGGDDLH